MAAWHRAHADGLQIAALLPGPAGALPHYSTHRKRTGGAAGPALRTPRLKDGAVSLFHCCSEKQPVELNYPTSKKHLKTNRCQVIFFF